LACDLRWAHARAFFAIPVSRLGLVFPLAGIKALAAAVGSTRCLELLHTGRRLMAAEALSWGLLNGVREGFDWDQVGEQAVDTMRSLAPLSLEGHHRILRHLIRGDLDPRLAQAIATKALQSRDAREGALAIGEKRSPRFAGE